MVRHSGIHRQHHRRRCAGSRDGLVTAAQIATPRPRWNRNTSAPKHWLANILPASIANRLKDRSNSVIADKYDDASILFADIAGYTSGPATPRGELVAFLDDLYTSLDALVTRHGLEK